MYTVQKYNNYANKQINSEIDMGVCDSQVMLKGASGLKSYSVHSKLIKP